MPARTAPRLPRQSAPLFAAHHGLGLPSGTAGLVWCDLGSRLHHSCHSQQLPQNLYLTWMPPSIPGIPQSPFASPPIASPTFVSPRCSRQSGTAVKGLLTSANRSQTRVLQLKDCHLKIISWVTPQSPAIYTTEHTHYFGQFLYLGTILSRQFLSEITMQF